MITTPNGRIMGVFWGLASLVGVSMFIAVIVAFVQFLGEAAASAEEGFDIFGIILVVMLIAVGLFAVLAVLGLSQLIRTSLRVHENGIDAKQSWFRSAQIPWASIDAIHPPDPAEQLQFFKVTTNDRRLITVSRLNLATTAKPTGSGDEPSPALIEQHPDVALVIEHYERWAIRSR